MRSGRIAAFVALRMSNQTTYRRPSSFVACLFSVRHRIRLAPFYLRAFCIYLSVTRFFSHIVKLVQSFYFVALVKCSYLLLHAGLPAFRSGVNSSMTTSHAACPSVMWFSLTLEIAWSLEDSNEALPGPRCGDLCWPAMHPKYPGSGNITSPCGSSSVAFDPTPSLSVTSSFLSTYRPLSTHCLRVTSLRAASNETTQIISNPRHGNRHALKADRNTSSDGSTRM